MTCLYIGKINITIPDKVKVVLAGNIKNIEGYSYVSISEVIGALGIEYKVSNKKTYIELEYNNNQILITALSSFVVINDIAYDLFKPSISNSFLAI